MSDGSWQLIFRRQFRGLGRTRQAESVCPPAIKPCVSLNHVPCSVIITIISLPAGFVRSRRLRGVAQPGLAR